MSDAILNKDVVVAFANAGKAYGKQLTVLVNAFKLAREHKIDAAGIDAYQSAFYLNGVRGALGASEKRAALVVSGSKNGGLSPFNFKEPEKMGDANRTYDEQRVFDALKSAWSTARKVAGFPMKAIAPRAAKSGQGAAAPVAAERLTALVALDEAVIESVDQDGLLQTFAAAYRLLSRSLNAGGAEIIGDVGSVLRGAIVDMHAALVEAGYDFEAA